MKGLLYKDYKLMKGNRYIAALIIITLVLFIIYFGMSDVNARDTILGAFLMVVPCLLFIIVSAGIANNILAVDEQKNAKVCIFSLPITRKKYVTSKYLLLIMVYAVVLVFSEMWGMIFKILCHEGMEVTIKNSVKNMMPFFPTIAGIAIIVSAAELMIFILFGAKNGKQIKNILMFLLMFLFLVYLFFGDLSVFDKINIIEILEFFQKHKNIKKVVQIGTPIMAIILYAVSYVFTSYMYEKKENI